MIGNNVIGKDFMQASWILLCTLLCVISPWLAGCSPQQRADIVIINGADPESLDPIITTGQPDIRATGALFAGLTSPNPQTGLPDPCLAERWEISPDGKIYTFHLRPNLRWSTGQKLTAHDIVYSWRRLLTPQNAAPYAGLLYPLLNAEAYNTGKITDPSLLGIRALDDNTLRVELRLPTAYFLDLCAMVTLAAVPSFAIEANPDQWIRLEPLPVSGAYTLEEWRLNDRIRLRKNPLYWDAAHTQNETVDLLPISNSVTAQNLYQLGEADILWDKELIPSDLMDIMLKRPDVHPFDYLGVYFARINVTHTPLNNPLVRKALSMAIDRQALVDRVTRAGEKIATHFTPSGCANYTPPEGPSFDPVRARQLLAQAGFPNGEGFPTITYLFNASAGGAAKTHQKIAVEMQEMWKQYLNINVDLRQTEWKASLAMMNNLEYDICRSSWIGDYNDATSFLNLFTSNDGNNRTGWKNTQYDALIEHANEEADMTKRAKILAEAETILLQEGTPLIPLFFYKGIFCFDTNKMEGIYPNPVDHHPINAIHKKTKTI